MSPASDKLARNRAAILEQIARRQRRHDPREAAGEGEPYQFSADATQAPGADDFDPGEGWFGHMKHAVRTWWRYHPAQMAVEVATPMLRSYARRKPAQLIGISLAAGAALTFARPWRLISLTTLAIAIVKSTDLPRLLMASMAAADFSKDANRPE